MIDVPFISWVTATGVGCFFFFLFLFLSMLQSHKTFLKNEEPTKQKDEVYSVNKQPFLL